VTSVQHDLIGGPAVTGARARRRPFAVGGDRALVVAVGVLALLALLAITAPLWWSKDATTIDPVNMLVGPSAAHPMGTDDLGRDVFARVLGGARISLLVGLGVAVSGGLVGSALGIFAGLRSGVGSVLVQRVFDTLAAFPSLILAMAVTVGLGAGLVTSCIGAALSTVPVFGRTVRSDVLRVRSSGYVESARALGVPPLKIVWRHVLPHILPTILAQMAAVFSFGILTVAALGFVGLGAQIPTPEWGAMITDGSQYVVAGQWWIGVFPGLALLFATAATGVIADRVQTILDPRSAGGRTML
jgi:peptide/nickel transport system permease protein